MGSFEGITFTCGVFSSANETIQLSQNMVLVHDTGVFFSAALRGIERSRGRAAV